MKSIYLDYAAATPLDPKVFDAMKPYFNSKFYNPSATYLASRDIRHDLDDARKTIAGWLGSRPSEVYFTAGATEANNLAISGLMSRFPEGEVLVSSIEHDSVIAPGELYKCNKIASTSKGIIDLDDLKKKMTNKTILVSTMYVNNELGTVQPLREISKIISEERSRRLNKGNKTPIYLHTDAAQAGNFFDLHVARLGVDLMSINGGKIYGPKQTGILYVKAGIEIQPLIVGGGQERALRSGTENVAGSIGLAKALDIAQEPREQNSKKTMELRETFIKGLGKNIPDAQINGLDKHRAPHIVSVTFPGVDNERLMMELDERGVQCAVGSACSASSGKPSHVLSAIGLSDEQAQATLRFSFGRYTRGRDIHKTLTILKSLMPRQQ